MSQCLLRLCLSGDNWIVQTLMKKAQTLSILVTVFGVVFALEATTMQFVYRSLDVYATPLSMYATGSLWYVVSSGLVMIATSYLILAYLFLQSSDSMTLRLRAGSMILIAVGVCTYVLTIFQTDIGKTVSLRGNIHVVAASSKSQSWPPGSGVRDRLLPEGAPCGDAGLRPGADTVRTT